MPLLFLIFILLITALIGIIGRVIACWLTGIKIESIQVFYGAPIYTVYLKKTKIEFGYIPIGCSIKHDFEDFDSRIYFTRMFVIVSGPLLIFLSTLIILSFHQAFSEVIIGLGQIIQGTFSPNKVAIKLISNYCHMAYTTSFFYLYALITTKILSLELLPVPTLCVGRLLLELIPSTNGLKKKIFLQTLGYVITLMIFIVWIYAFINQSFS
jgi:hypothetical protein